MTRSTPNGFNIGTVSRLTGIARERIRIWERRYSAVVPARDDGNNRLYSQQDVDRLMLIRRLVDAGNAIGQVARLPLDDLATRLDALALPAGARPPVSHALAFGPDAQSLGAQLRALGVPEVALAEDAAAAEQWLTGQATDLLVAGYPTLVSQESAGLLRLHRSAPRQPFLLVYRFAPARLLEQLTRLGIRTIKAPLDPADLLQPALPAPAPDPRHSGDSGDSGFDYRTRQFSPTDLQRLGALGDLVACECPQHLANLVRDLQAFEDYSLACEVATPADAALHREVYEVIARARALTEDALAIIAAEEQIAV